MYLWHRKGPHVSHISFVYFKLKEVVIGLNSRRRHLYINNALVSDWMWSLCLLETLAFLVFTSSSLLFLPGLFQLHFPGPSWPVFVGDHRHSCVSLHQFPWRPFQYVLTIGANYFTTTALYDSRLWIWCLIDNLNSLSVVMFLRFFGKEGLW